MEDRFLSNFSFSPFFASLLLHLLLIAFAFTIGFEVKEKLNSGIEVTISLDNESLSVKNNPRPDPIASQTKDTPVAEKVAKKPDQPANQAVKTNKKLLQDTPKEPISKEKEPLKELAKEAPAITEQKPEPKPQPEIEPKTPTVGQAREAKIETRAQGALSARERFNVLTQIRGCYKIVTKESKLTNPEDTIVTIRVTKAKMIENNLDEVIDISKYNSDQNYRSTIDGIRRVFEICSPLRNVDLKDKEVSAEIMLKFGDSVRE